MIRWWCYQVTGMQEHLDWPLGGGFKKLTNGFYPGLCTPSWFQERYIVPLY